MELPAALREAVERALAGVALAELAQAADALSQRYRAELQDGRPHVADDVAARAYLATRLPATYAAICASLNAVAELRPDFAPASLLDVGAGPGTALWAATARWPSLTEALLVEGSPAMRRWGERLAAAAPLGRIEWRAGEAEAMLADLAPRDAVTLGYVLSELAPAAREALVDRLWELTAGTLVIVEPGTPAGWVRLMAARNRLLAAGAHLIAPCPHEAACPLTPPDWCHFAERLPRSRLHRQAKGGEAPFEDEKFGYLAVSRRPGPLPAARILAPPRAAPGRVRLKLCLAEGRADERLVSRRQREAFRLARRCGWGDALPPD